MQPWLPWMIVGLILLIVEMFSMTFFLMWVGAGALLAALLAAFVPAPTWLHWLVFSASSVIMLILSRPLARSLHARVSTPSNVDSMIGKIGVVLETIDPHANTGRIRIGSDEWRARCPEKILQGEKAVVKGIEGTTLQVAPVPPEPEAPANP
jgi:inner membrane protein